MLKGKEKLNNRQNIAIELLVMGKSGKEVAEKLSVSQETVCRWQKEPLFNKILNDMLNEMRETSNKRLIGLINTAVDAIEAGFKDINISTRDRFVMGVKFLELCRRNSIELKTENPLIGNNIIENSVNETEKRKYRLSMGISL